VPNAELDDGKGTPRWVKLLAIIAVVIVGLMIGIHLLLIGGVFGAHMPNPPWS